MSQELKSTASKKLYFSNNEYPKSSTKEKAYFIDYLKGALGVYTIDNSKYFFYVKSSVFLGIFESKKFYRIKEISYYHLKGNLSEEIEEYKNFLENYYFFYSKDFLEAKSFIWNEYNIKELESESLNKNGIVYLYSGYLYADFGSSLKLASFISKRRIGSRYLSRGIEDSGNVSFFVKTVFQADENEIISYRGSVPLFWEQSDDIMKEVGFIKEPSQTNSVFKKHFEKIKNDVNKNSKNLNEIIVLNLLGKRKGETKLSDEYRKTCNIFNVIYYEFDLNKFQFDYETLHKNFFELLEKIFSENSGKKIFFRVNCLDCLDRTNIAEMLICEYNLNKSKYFRDVSFDSDNIYDDKSEYLNFKKIWTENGNFLSQFYSGTSAHKNELTSKGKRSIQGIVGDLVITATRAVHGNLTDYQKHKIINNLTSNFQKNEIEKNFKKIPKIDFIQFTMKDDSLTLNIEKLNSEILFVSMFCAKNLAPTFLDVFINEIETKNEMKLLSKKNHKKFINFIFCKSDYLLEIKDLEYSYSSTFTFFGSNFFKLGCRISNINFKILNYSISNENDFFSLKDEIDSYKKNDEICVSFLVFNCNSLKEKMKMFFKGYNIYGNVRNFILLDKYENFKSKNMSTINNDEKYDVNSEIFIQLFDFQ